MRAGPGSRPVSREVSTEVKAGFEVAGPPAPMPEQSRALHVRPPADGVNWRAAEPRSPYSSDAEPGNGSGRSVSPEERLGQQFCDMLAQAISSRDARDDKLTVALRPVVEKALRASVQAAPKFFADILFPLIGPAIRRAMAEALRSMVGSFSRALAMTFSWRYIRWRFEAIRTGRPFSEVVLLHTLVYRVEQLFLLHRESGLPIRHVSAQGVASQDADVVSSMLIAIRDFVHDSFGGADDALESFRVGELGVWIEQGPDVVLAAVVRGSPPVDYGVLLRTHLELIELEWGPELAAFEGDPAPYSEVDALLEPCLIAA